MSTATATSKNFITFGNWLTSKELSVNEQHLLNILFRYHNCNYGYAFPKISDLMKAFNTTSANRVIDTIKKLESKGLIRVNRAKKKNNTYLITGIERFISNFVAPSEKKEEKQKKKPEKVKKSIEEKILPVDSNGEIPLEGQVSFFDEVEEVKQEVKEATPEEVKEDSKVKKVLESFTSLKLSKKEKEIISETDESVLNHAIDSITVEKINGTYFLEAINRAKRNMKNLVDGINPFKFNNFKAREYDWDSLEAQLLGWDNVVEEPKEIMEEEGVQLGIDWLGLEENEYWN
ncbi:hypothetical protein [uncultured Clostridium sp.]|uniref:hypothetical protein n=1 Tax=uncultured Clostridium sp. TaxID=59620 RepID=UPI00273067F7|nr:hypothetical protein [uncultured Clostridium sp.]